jgi:hypothetical protein
MKELTKGTLVMTEMGLAWYDRIENGEHLVNPITWENDHLSPHFNASVATRAQVEEKIKEMGWSSEYLSNTWEKNLYSVCEDPTFGVLIFQPDLTIEHFDNAPAQQAEAILVARMLNATKD